jgi:hypothetical protein
MWRSHVLFITHHCSIRKSSDNKSASCGQGIAPEAVDSLEKGVEDPYES